MNAPVFFFFSLHLMIMRAYCLVARHTVRRQDHLPDTHSSFQAPQFSFSGADDHLPLNQIEPAGMLHIFPCYFGMSSMTC